MKNALSPTMRDAYTYATNNGGVLVRFPGGYNQPVEWKVGSQASVVFGTSTIEALVKRGYAIYTKWQDGKKKPFPIEVTMVSKD